MRIRIEGELRELDAAVDQLRRLFEIVTISKPYKNRNSELFRVYIETKES